VASLTDADAVLAECATAKAFQLAQENSAALVSFSPEQSLKTWYEKTLIPFVFCRLARKFSYADVNNPNSPLPPRTASFFDPAFHLRRRWRPRLRRWRSFGRRSTRPRAKQDSWGIWFGSGAGFVSVRMYRSFRQMWAGWRKNLYQLMGGNSKDVFHEFESAFPWMTLLVLLFGIKFPLAMFIGALLLIFAN